jgi:hypothetical protein
MAKKSAKRVKRVSEKVGFEEMNVKSKRCRPTDAIAKLSTPFRTNFNQSQSTDTIIRCSNGRRFMQRVFYCPAQISMFQV